MSEHVEAVATPRRLPATPETCDRCGARIVWAVTVAGPNGPGGKAMPLDLRETDAGNVAAYPAHGRRLLARVLQRDEDVDRPLEYRAMPHFATCAAGRP